MVTVKQEKDQLIADFRMHEHDTGSSSIQIALMTEKIKLLTEHCRTHPKDMSSRRGLVIMVSKRRRLLKYLKKEDITSYANLLKKLELKGI